MGKIKNPEKVKLIIGLIFNEESLLLKVKSILFKVYGKIDFESSILEFNFTGYYQKEIGLNLKRQFISFEKLIDPSDLSKIKVKTNNIEDKFLTATGRKINIDPGYLHPAKLVLASTKDYAHRIYLDRGIYAEITLQFKGKSYEFLTWTYPDYQTQEYIQIFNQIRQVFFEQIKK